LVDSTVGEASGMAWEEQVFALLEDLEGQADSLYDAERRVELADRSRAEYAGVTLSSRLAASVGAEVELEVSGVGRLAGRLDRVAAGWLGLESPRQAWVVRTAAVVEVHGASPRALPEVAWASVDRLGVGSAVRRMADAAEPCQWHRLDGGRLGGVPLRVGADFVEVRIGREQGEAGRTVLVALDALAAVAQVASRS
jgi:hypothetical protein